MTIPKGGRGKKAPYETQQMRVPTPIKDRVNILIAKFRGDVLNDPKTDDDLFGFADNSKTLAELEKLQTEIENLKTALGINEKENLSLKTALAEANQHIGNLSTALVDARSQLLNLSTSLEEAKQKSINLNTGNIQGSIAVGFVIGEGEAQKFFDLKREIFRTPRERGEKIVSFNHKNKLFSLEYDGQPKGAKTPHYWKITKIEDAPQEDTPQKNLPLAI